MHDDDNPRRELTTAEADDRDQEGILAHLIAEHPDQLTITELAREMRQKKDTALIPDWLERGVRDLIALGLLHRSGDTIRPTRAALRFNHLFFDRDEAKNEED
jgi:DNA-binding IclR family transcriptional regulator